MHIADAALTSPPRLQVRISCAGFPTKMLYEDFVDHFWNLVPHLLARSDLTDSDIGRAIVDQAHLKGYQAGKTKVSSLIPPPLLTFPSHRSAQCPKELRRNFECIMK